MSFRLQHPLSTLCQTHIFSLFQVVSMMLNSGWRKSVLHLWKSTNWFSQSLWPLSSDLITHRHRQKFWCHLWFSVQIWKVDKSIYSSFFHICLIRKTEALLSFGDQVIGFYHPASPLFQLPLCWSQSSLLRLLPVHKCHNDTPLSYQE